MATRTRRMLLGCGVGCLGLAMLAVGACVGGTIWLGQPGELLEPTRLLGRDTTGHVEWTLRDDDPGSEAFVEGLLDLIARSREERAGHPVWLTRLLRANRDRERAQAMGQLLPTVLVWTVRPGETTDSDLHLFSVSMAGMGNRIKILDLIMRLTVGLKHGAVYRDERIYEDESGAVFIRGSHVFVTNSPANARLAVDRLHGESRDLDREPTALEFRLAALPETPLKGSVSNARGELTRVWRELADLDPESTPPEIWSAIRGATLTGGFTGPTSFESVIEFEGPDAEWSRASAAGFGARLREGLGLSDLPAELHAEAQGNSIRVAVRIDDVFALLRELQRTSNSPSESGDPGG